MGTVSRLPTYCHLALFLLLLLFLKLSVIARHGKQLAYSPTTQKARQGGHKFKASLSNTLKPYLIKKKSKSVDKDILVYK